MPYFYAIMNRSLLNTSKIVLLLSNQIYILLLLLGIPQLLMTLVPHICYLHPIRLLEKMRLFENEAIHPLYLSDVFMF